MERGTGIEPVISGFAIRCLTSLATHATWSRETELNRHGHNDVRFTAGWAHRVPIPWTGNPDF